MSKTRTFIKSHAGTGFIHKPYNRTPLNEDHFEKLNITIKRGKFSLPVYVDVISGKIYTIPSANWKKTGNDYQFLNIPVYDAPIIITDKSPVKINTNQ